MGWIGIGKMGGAALFFCAIVTDVTFADISNCAPVVERESHLYLHEMLQDSLEGLNKMRRHGLLMDTVQVKQENDSYTIVPYKTASAPTDIALDLMIQSRLVEVATLTTIIDRLWQLPYHARTGLFYRWYEIDRDESVTMTDLDLSAVDNLHLAIALKEVSVRYHDTQVGDKAKAMFARMNFSEFYDPATGLVGGNLKHHSGQWTLEAHRFHFGSEARLLYTEAKTLGLYRDITPDFRNIPLEIKPNHGDPFFSTWDGGVFQMLLPTLFADETHNFPWIKKSYRNFVSLLHEKEISPGVSLPWALSACVTRVEEFEDLSIVYDGKMGFTEAKERANPDFVGNDTTTFHAVLLAATIHSHWAVRLQEIRELKIDGQKIYLDGFGFVDSVSLRAGSPAVNSVGVGLDKAIETMSLVRLIYGR